MQDEKRPLLLLGTPPDETNNGDEISEDEENSSSLRFSHFSIPTYGATFRRPTKVILPEDRITYTWSEINVFTKIQRSPRESCFRLLRRKLEPGPRKHILKNVTGVAYPGELLAILGSSGAGKTTLLNTLTFRSSRNVTVSGLRCMNGKPVTPRSLTSQSAYVQQDDLFIGNLTVREHLVFQALVRMDRDISYSRRMERVEEVISELSLTKCQNTQIGIKGRIKGISGGEMKRLSFAAEVLTNPCLMFCDEPTSGLDSFMAFNVIQVLKTMALTGKTVICTIHQPSSEIYAMFDKILLMSEGRTAFLGSPEEADNFFRELEAPCPKNYNPADYFVQLLAIVPEKEKSCRQAVNLICDRYEKSEMGARVMLEAMSKMADPFYHDIWISNGNGHVSPYKAGWFAQFGAVLWRSWLTIIKEPLLIKDGVIRAHQIPTGSNERLGRYKASDMADLTNDLDQDEWASFEDQELRVIALIVGLIFYGQQLDENGVMNINGALFLFLTNMTFQNLFAVINSFCSELPIFLRENRNGMYRTDVYFLCKTLAETPLFMILPIMFTSVCYYMIGLNPAWERFLTACAITVLVANAALSFGYLVSCVSSNLAMALSVGPPIIIPFLLFGGFFLNIGSVPFYFEWLAYLSWFRYGNEALLINQWENVTNIECDKVNSTCPRDGHVVLEVFNFDESHFTLDLVALGVLIVAFRVVAFLGLLIKTHRY